MKKHPILPLLRLLPFAALVAAVEAKPQWIWAAPKAKPGQTIWVRRTFNLEGPAKGARLSVSADNTWELWINGEFAGRGVTANAIAPGFISTDMTGALSEEIRNGILGKIPLGTFGEVGDIAAAALYLASAEARYVTGQVLVVDGGMVM